MQEPFPPAASLTPSQRATLLLRDVVELSADETASALEMTTSAANAALFRARRVVEGSVDVASFGGGEVLRIDHFMGATTLRVFGRAAAPPR